MRVERPLSTGEIRNSLSTIEEEFRARASDPAPEELWLLIDPADGSIVDLVAGPDIDDKA